VDPLVSGEETLLAAFRSERLRVVGLLEMLADPGHPDDLALLEGPQGGR
jgi:hypothetical protein